MEYILLSITIYLAIKCTKWTEDNSSEEGEINSYKWHSVFSHLESYLCLNIIFTEYLLLVTIWKAWTHAQSCPTLCHSMDCTLSGFSVHGIFQARILEWVAISFSRGSSRPRDQTCVSCVSCTGRQIPYHSGPPGNQILWRWYGVRNLKTNCYLCSNLFLKAFYFF